MIRHYLNFISSGYGMREIDEPFGFDKIPFGIRQDSGRRGRDVFYAGGGEAKFNISPAVDVFGFHFDVFLRDWKRYGFEIQIEYLCDFGDGIEVVGNVAQVTTNHVDNISFVVTQKLAEAKLKRNYDVAADLFSPLDISGQPITPAQTSRMLVRAKPILQASEWTNPRIGREIFSDSEQAEYFNVVANVVKSDIQNTLSWFDDFNDEGSDDFRHIQFATNATNVNVKITHTLKFDYDPNPTGSNKQGFLRLRVYWGQSIVEAIENNTFVNVWQTVLTGNSNQSVTMPAEFNVPIPFINSTDILWVGYTIQALNSVVKATIGESKTRITATTIAYNTVINVVRYIDGLKYAVKSAGGNNVVAPRIDFGGEFYNQFITNTALMRNLTDKPFNISVKDFVEEHIRPEWNGDYEVQNNGDIFVGLYRDFYRDYEMAVFDQAQFEDYEESENDKYKVNKIVVGFKNYASQKENEEDNTYDIVHGDSEWKTPNEFAENTREAKIGFIRDAFLMALAQRKSYETADTAATQDDDKVYIIDTAPLAPGTNFTETAYLQHDYDADTGILTVRSSTNPENGPLTNWILLGIVNGVVFQILSGANQGVYIVAGVTATELKLGGGLPGVDILAQNTTFKYFIDPTINLVNRTNQGFSQITGLADGQNYANLRFTAKRVLVDYYNEESATICKFHPGQPLRNTLYKNNPNAATQLVGGPLITEGDNTVPTGAILTPYVVNSKTIMTLDEFWNIRNRVRIDRGYIKIFDPEGLPVKTYIQEGEWTPLEFGDLENDERKGIFDITGEVKYEPVLMDIFADGDVFMINGTMQPTGFSFSIDDLGYLIIFDSTGKQLNIPVQWDNVSVNGNMPANVSQLGLWLSQYDTAD